MARKPIEQLTGDHMLILACIAKGMTNPQIGDRMGHNARWVNDQLRIVFRLLGAHTRAQAVALAARKGLILDE